MDPVVHFEMPYEDRERAAKFYGEAFGWKANMLGPEMGDYVTVSTTESDPKTGFPKEIGRINGGLFKKSDENQQVSIVIAVEDIEEAMRKVNGSGGQVDGEPNDIPGIGKYVAFRDPEGNKIAMLQPNPMETA